MRIDLLMNKLCLVKSRNVGKTACDKGLVLVNAKAVKASYEVKTDDEIEITMYGYKTTIKLTDIPTGNVAKKDSANYYTLLVKEKII